MACGLSSNPAPVSLRNKPRTGPLLHTRSIEKMIVMQYHHDYQLEIEKGCAIYSQGEAITGVFRI
jgi:hypothetical protein